MLEVCLTGTMVVTITQLVWVNFRGAAMVEFMLLYFVAWLVVLVFL